MGFATILLMKFLSSHITTCASSAPMGFTHRLCHRESRQNQAYTNLRWRDKFLNQLGSISNTHIRTHTSIPISKQLLLVILINSPSRL
jgi:hypothetical protein